MPIRIWLQDCDLVDQPTGHGAVPYISTGHIRTALRHADGVVVVFHDGLVTAGPWGKVCRAYPQPMRRVFARPELDILVDVSGVTQATRLANVHLQDSPGR